MEHDSEPPLKAFISGLSKAKFDRYFGEVVRADWGDDLRNVFQYDFILQLGFPIPSRYPNTIGTILEEIQSYIDKVEMTDEYEEELYNLLIAYRYVVELADDIATDSRLRKDVERYKADPIISKLGGLF